MTASAGHWLLGRLQFGACTAAALLAGVLLVAGVDPAAAQSRGKGKAAPPAAEPPPAEAASEPVEPSQPPLEPLKRLRLMLLDLADLREPDSRDAFEPPRTAFRHTFGSQRRTSDETLPLLVNAAELGADVVVLRGITNPRLARRMFPARDWRFMQGRNAPPTGEPRVRTLAPPALPEPSTAVAMWLQQGVRFAGTEPASSPGSPLPSLGASMRMFTGLGPMWVLSPSAACREPCKPVEDWLGAKVGGGALALVGGVLPAVALPPGQPVGGAPAAGALSKPAPKGAVALAARHTNGIVTLTGLDAGGRCGGDAKAALTLHLRHPPARKPLKVAGYLWPLERPAPAVQPGGKSPPTPVRPACVLLLDIEAG